MTQISKARLKYEIYSDPSEFEWPQDDQRVVIVGRTGSGKTQFAFLLLSMASFDRMPWIIFDYKGEKLFDELIGRGYAKLVAVGYLPKEPGIYVVRPAKGHDDDAVEAYLDLIRVHENIGLFIDELYMIDPRSDAMQALLTQGRSKNIPMISLTQRPVLVSRFNFSESNHVVLFHLTQLKDRKTVSEDVPIDTNVRLEDYHSRWYNVDRAKLFHVQPAPGREAILKRFDERLKVEQPEKPTRIVL